METDICTSFDKVLDAIESTTIKNLELSFIGGGKPSIQKVPEFLGSIENAERLFSPDIVSIGPLHYDREHLRGMEGIKKLAAREFCCNSPYQVRDFYHRVVEVAAQARKSYAGNFSGIGDGEFTAMLFFDGCFLLQFMATVALDRGPPLNWKMPQLSQSCVRRISRDILLVENQIPWFVLKALMRLRHVNVDRYIADTISDFDEQGARPEVDFEGADKYKPFHLLDLVRHRQVGAICKEEEEKTSKPMLSIGSALDLAEIGVHLTASMTARFADIGVRKGAVFGKLRLPPLYLGEVTMCWMANMAAFEMLQGGSSDYGVSSYLQILAVLMNRPEDVRELCAKHVLYPVFTDKETLNFFKSICPHLPYGRRYDHVMQQLGGYRQGRWVRVTLHKFLYNNYKLLLAVGSALGVLVTVLKAILSLKQTNGSAPVAPPHAF